MATPTIKMKKTEPNKKKIIIISCVIAVVCLSAAGGLYIKFNGGDERDEHEGRFRFNDANMPNPRNQSAEQIMKYRNSEKYKKLSPREQMMYTGASMRTMMDHHTETYFTLPAEQKTAYLDKLIDEMQQNMKNFEQMRNQFPRPERRRDANDVNDPNAQKRREERMAQRNNPSNVRSMRERGDPEERAKQTQFRQAMQKRMQERGIQMPRFGGGPGGGRGGR